MSEIEIDQTSTEETPVTNKADIFAKPAPEHSPIKEVAEVKVASPVDNPPAKTVVSPVEKVDEDKATTGDETVEEVKPKKNVVQWQCKYRRYQMILDIVNAAAEKLVSGRKVMQVIKARNWRIPLDLDDAEDLAIHNALLRSSQNGNEFRLLEDAKKGKTDLPERGNTLKLLWDMPDDQLMGMLDDEEFEEAGLTPGIMPDRQELILAIIDSKKLIGGTS